MRVNPALFELVIDDPTVVRYASRVHHQNCRGNKYILRDVRVPRLSSSQGRPASNTDPKPRTLLMGTGNLPRLCDTAHFSTATISRAPLLPTAAENRRASGILPTAPTLQPCTGHRPGLKVAASNPASRPRVLQRPLKILFLAPLPPHRELSPLATLPIAQLATWVRATAPQ